MKRLVIMLSLTVSMLASSAVFASLYGWNPAKRPPITLSDALLRAEKLLGDDAVNRYCVSVSLYGNERGDGESGAWNLFYAGADGSQRHIYIGMDGKAKLTMWNGPTNTKKEDGCRADLLDVRRQIEDLCSREQITPKITIQDDSLFVKFQTREYQIHQERPDGGYAVETEKIEGPDHNGFWLQVRIVDRVDRLKADLFEGPYWRWIRGTYYTTDAGKYLSVDLRCGTNLTYQRMSQLLWIIGDPTREH